MPSCSGSAFTFAPAFEPRQVDVIVQAGALLPAPYGLWFTLRLPQLAPGDAGLFRIGVSRRSLVPWPMARLSMDAAARAAHDRRLKAQRQKPDHVLVSFESIPRERWTSIERWNGFHWIPLEQGATAVANPDGSASFVERGSAPSAFAGNRVKTTG